MSNFLRIINGMFATFVEDLASTTTGSDPTLDPIYNMLSVLLPSAMAIVFGVGAIYGIVLGVRYAKASGAEEREKAKKSLINMIIGVVMVIVLLGILYAIREPLTSVIS